ncbi:hypothetical protein Clst_2260 [Thermoclostridium stercorarium subsp. stercorarium DSM 8532]|nr:hypothetical protein Clst_2260 [Thermoclostridium stercorarium subsp. stercorarium DSM 8532]
MDLTLHVWLKIPPPAIWKVGAVICTEKAINNKNFLGLYCADNLWYNPQCDVKWSG